MRIHIVEWAGFGELIETPFGQAVFLHVVFFVDGVQAGSARFGNN